MATINSFEGLDSWKNARIGVNLIYKNFLNIRDFCFRDQIFRASISVMNNIAEGFGRQTPKEKINFMNIAHGSLMEVRSMLYLGKDLGYLDELGFNEAMKQNLHTIQILRGFMRYLHSIKNRK